MKKLKRSTVIIIVICILSAAFITTLGTTIYYKSLTKLSVINGIREDNRTFKDNYTGFKRYVFSGTEFIKDMYFRVMLPDNYDESVKYPVLMYIHGNGSQGGNNDISNADAFIDNYLKVKDRFPAIVFVPQFPKGMHGNGNSLYKGSAAYLLMSCLKAGVLDKYSVDHSKIYSTGVSMGGFTSVYLAELFPTVFAAIMPLCGGTDASTAVVASKIRHIPSWFAHSKDDKVVPFSYTDNLHKELIKLGANSKFTVYENKDHNIARSFYSQEGIENGEDIWAWLFSQEKDN